MSAFLVCEVTVKDRERLLEYLRLSEHTLAPFGGRFLAQAGQIDVVEGTWNPVVVIIVDFPTMDKAREWYGSDTYAEALKLKSQAMDRNMIITEGLT